MIILDTNVVSELMKAQPDPVVLAWADRQAPTTLFITSITLAEIRFGIMALPAGRRRTSLRNVFENHIRPLFADRVLDFDDAASAVYAEIRAAARNQGRAISDLDAMIAAIARVNRYAVATRDTAPFEAVGTTTIDPFARR